MRPRKSSFGVIPYKALQEQLNASKVYGLFVKILPDVLIYTYVVMFRDNKNHPEELYITVSRRSKLVIKIESDRREFLNLQDFIDKVIIKKDRV